MTARVLSINAARLNRIAARINAAQAKAAAASKTVVECAIEIGELLIEAKESFAHGEWSSWLKRNVSVTPRMCRNYVKLAKTIRDMPLSKRKCISLLPLNQALLVITGNPKPGLDYSGVEDWYTPEHLVERVRNVLGEIDLDPASSAKAQLTVKAKRFYTAKSDGLKHEWRGATFMNPPYTRNRIPLFIDKLIMHHGCGDIPEAIVLVSAYTDSSWFQRLAAESSAICFTKSRVRFNAPNKRIAQPTQGQAFIYLGRNIGVFRREFSDLGFIVIPKR